LQKQTGGMNFNGGEGFVIAIACATEYTENKMGRYGYMPFRNAMKKERTI